MESPTPRASASERATSPRLWSVRKCQCGGRGCMAWAVTDANGVTFQDFIGSDAESHARLFVAADALLAACKASVALIVGDMNEPDAEDRIVLPMLRAAIAAAEVA